MEKIYNFNNKSVVQNDRPDAKSFLLFQNKRSITFLFKLFLTELEGMRDENLISDEYFKKQRKLVLDRSNVFIREFEDELNKFEIKFKRGV